MSAVLAQPLERASPTFLLPAELLPIHIYKKGQNYHIEA